MTTLRAALIIPSHNGAKGLVRLFESYQTQTRKIDALVVDSSSSDNSAVICRQYGAHVDVIMASEFSHGGTRQLMVDRYADYDAYVFLTQDTYLADDYAIERILEPLQDEKVGVVCGRQLPHLNATHFAAHARQFNYADISMRKSIAMVRELGIKAAFVSNSFAAYRRTALMEAGGFPAHVILAEDMYAAAKILLNGWEVHYAAEARCYHSHNYSLFDEFRRYFDTGVFHRREPWIGEKFKGVQGEGRRYVVSEIRCLGLRNIHLWPVSLLRNGLKFLGYKFGTRERFLPYFLKRYLSMHRQFWDESHM